MSSLTEGAFMTAACCALTVSAVWCFAVGNYQGAVALAITPAAMVAARYAMDGGDKA